MTIGEAATEMGSLMSMGGGRWDPRRAEAQGQGCARNQDALAYRDLWGWLIDHGVPRNETDGQPTRIRLDLWDRKHSTNMT